MTNAPEIKALKALLDHLKRQNILVVGDIMLDCFVYGSVERISPEAPVSVLKVEKEARMLGGAGNVLANLAALGANASIVAVTGKDEAGREIRKIAEGFGADVTGVLADADRPSIRKTRYIGKNQHLLRVDEEDIRPLSASAEAQALQMIEAAMAPAGAVILSDYGKGFLTDNIITQTIHIARAKGLPVLVDPKRKDYSIYNGATAITPNRAELAAATGGMAVHTDADIEAACRVLLASLDIDAVIATRSEAGMSVIARGADPVHISHEIHEVFDVSGAGDTVIAVLGAIMAAGGNAAQAATLANLAGGVAVSRIGTSQVTVQDIEQALDKGFMAPIAAHALPRSAGAFADWEQAAAQIRIWQGQGKKVGFTNGCFDIIHFGHVSYLEQARQRCDVLVVGLNHDQSVKILKGPERPVNDENARAAVIGALASVDMVAFFGATEPGGDNTPCDLLSALKPDIIFKGGDYKIEDLPEAQVVMAYGGEVEIMPLYEGHSTSNIIAKSKSAAE